MRWLFTIVFVFAPIMAQACEWQVRVLDRTTNEIKYYKVISGKRTEIPITNNGNGENFAACVATLEDLGIPEEDKKILTKVEGGVLLCAYTKQSQYPISATAQRFVYADRPEVIHRAIMTLYPVPDTGQKLKPLFTIQYMCKQ